MNLKIWDLIKRTKITLGFMVFTVVMLWTMGAFIGLNYSDKQFLEEHPIPTILLMLFGGCLITYILFFLIIISRPYLELGENLCAILIAILLPIISFLFCLNGLAIPCCILFPQEGLDIFIKIYLRGEWLSNWKIIPFSALIIICFYTCIGILLQLIILVFNSLSHYFKKPLKCRWPE